MKKQLLTDSIVYLLCMISACLLNLAVTALTLKIADSFVGIDYFAESIIRIITGALTCGTVLGAVVFFESYKSVEVNTSRLVGAICCSGVIHLLLSTLLMFYPFIAGGTRALAGVLQMGIGFDSYNMIKDIYLWTYLAAFAIYLIWQIAVAVTCAHIGKRTRLINREKLYNEKNNI